MFGFVVANRDELTKEQMKRYQQIYCGICRRIRMQHSGACRFALNYDLVFLALLLTSLYEPKEITGKRACNFHPIRPRAWADNLYISYCADMNVALSYYKSLDDLHDDHKLISKMGVRVFGNAMDDICNRYPRQCNAIETCLRELGNLERTHCDNPDLPANVFGKLMAELFVYREDRWAENLRNIGHSLGRFIYLADAAIDYRKDEKKERYNPFVAMQTGEDWNRWEQYLLMDMGACTNQFERLPLVQNTEKVILDNILYSGIWLAYRRKQRGADTNDG